MGTEKQWCIYKHTNKVNGKVYIGQTCDKPNLRWKNGKGYKNCTHFERAIQKYGWDNFEHEVLYKELTLEEADLLEQKLIKDYDAQNPNCGYNIKEGGHNCLQSEETKKKISESHIGITHSEETKRQLSESRIGENNPFYGKSHNDFTKQKMREKALGKNNHNWNKHPSEASREKMSQSHSKSVICIDTGEIYESAKIASLANNIDASSITKCCKGKRASCKGTHWKYYNKENE